MVSETPGDCEIRANGCNDFRCLPEPNTTMPATPISHATILSAGSIHGSLVITPDGVPVGTVQELIIDPVDMCVIFAIVDFGAAAIGLNDQRLPERQIAVPIELLEADSEKRQFILRFPAAPFLDAFPEEDRENASGPELAKTLASRPRNRTQWN